MKIDLNLSDKKLIILFLLFWFFSILGSNVYVGSTMLSIRNILFPTLFLVIFSLRKTPFTKQQKIISIPLVIFYLYGVFVLFFHNDYSLPVIKDFFYFSFIPIIYISVLLLANKYGSSFFSLIKGFTYFLIFFLFAITILEFISGIHLPVHAENRFNIPSAFFTNSNDLSVISIQLLFVISVLRKKTDPAWQYLIAFLMIGFIVFVTLSRLGLVAFIIVSLSIFLLNSFRWRDLVVNILFIGLTLAYMNIDIPTTKSSSSAMDRSKSRVSSISNIEAESEQKGSSANIRLDIYKIPLLQPTKFIFGQGYNSDKAVIEKYRTLDYKIINSHSFFIQTIFYFGWIGFGLLVFFFALLTYYALFSKPIWSYLVIIILTQTLLVNIPSSIMRFPLVWIPFFIAIAYYTNNSLQRKEIKNYATEEDF